MTRCQRFSLAVAAAAMLLVPVAALADPTTVETVYVWGAAKDPANASYPRDSTAAKAPELPVVYDKQTAPKDGSGKPKS